MMESHMHYNWCLFLAVFAMLTACSQTADLYDDEDVLEISSSAKRGGRVPAAKAPRRVARRTILMKIASGSPAVCGMERLQNLSPVAAGIFICVIVAAVFSLKYKTVHAIVAAGVSILYIWLIFLMGYCFCANDVGLFRI